MEIKNIFKLLWCCGTVLIAKITIKNVALKRNCLDPPLNHAIENVNQNFIFSFPP